MMHPLRAAPSPLALAAALVLAGCAEAPPPMTAPSAAAEAPPSLFGPSGAGTSPVDDEMLAIGKSEEEIDRLLPGAGRETSRQKATSPGPQKGDKAPTAKEEPAAPASDNDRCATACRALASMQRSAAHLCSLSGEGDGRCEDARGRLRGATARVRSACPTCAPQP